VSHFVPTAVPPGPQRYVPPGQPPRVPGAVMGYVVTYVSTHKAHNTKFASLTGVPIKEHSRGSLASLVSLCQKMTVGTWTATPLTYPSRSRNNRPRTRISRRAE
jgi:hypothetical protein